MLSMNFTNTHDLMSRDLFISKQWTRVSVQHFPLYGYIWMTEMPISLTHSSRVQKYGKYLNNTVNHGFLFYSSLFGATHIGRGNDQT